jgi:hypothetical protein
MWSSWTEKAIKALEETTEALSAVERRASESVTNALERTGEAITQAATKSTTPKQTADEAAFEQAIDSVEKEVADSNSAPFAENIHLPHIPSIDKAKMMNIWSTVVESTKQAAEATKIATKEAMDATKEVVETSRSNLERQFLKKGFYKRDPRLPLDAEALRDAEVVYITDR